MRKLGRREGGGEINCRCMRTLGRREGVILIAGENSWGAGQTLQNTYLPAMIRKNPEISSQVVRIIALM